MGAGRASTTGTHRRFNCRDVDPLRLDECRERLALVFEKGLRSPLGFSDTITMRHDVLRSIFPKMPTDLRATPYLADEEDPVRAELSPFIKKCLTVTGGGCLVNTPVKLFLGKSPAFLDEKGRRTRILRRPFHCTLLQGPAVKQNAFGRISATLPSSQQRL